MHKVIIVYSSPLLQIMIVVELMRIGDLQEHLFSLRPE